MQVIGIIRIPLIKKEKKNMYTKFRWHQLLHHYL